MHRFYEVYFYYGNANDCHVEKKGNKNLDFAFIPESCNCKIYLKRRFKKKMH